MLRRRLPSVFVPLALVVLAGCADGPRFGMPDPTSEQGRSILELYRGAMWVGVGVAALIWGLVVWSVVRYRRRNDDLPSQTPENIPIEVFYTVTPLVVVLVIFFLSMRTEAEVTDVVAEPDLVVDVTGFQWSWQFEYPDQGVVVRPDGFDQPELVVPVGATVRFNLETADVAHSFWVPEWLTKRDLIPGVENAMQIDVTEEGAWTGRCAEFCGIEHHSMLFRARAVSAEEFDDWVAAQRAGTADDTIDLGPEPGDDGDTDRDETR